MILSILQGDDLEEGDWTGNCCHCSLTYGEEKLCYKICVLKINIFILVWGLIFYFSFRFMFALCRITVVQAKIPLSF